MSVSQRNNIAYSLNQPLSTVFNAPIVSKRAPLTTDKAPIGAMWVNTSANTVYILSSVVANAATWLSLGAATGAFDALTVTGVTALTGASTLNGGAVNIGTDANANAVNVGTGAGAHVVALGSATGAASTTINGGTVGIALNAATGNLTATAPNATVASPTATVTNQAAIGQIRCTGFTTASAGSQTITITNGAVVTTSVIFVTVTTLGSNDAELTVTRVKPAAGTFAVTVVNNGAAAVNGTFYINYWIVSNAA